MRLIDADELIEKINNFHIADARCVTVMNGVVNLIKEQPTAYSVDKVVEGLEQKKEEVQRMRNTCVALSDLEVCDIENVTYERAIEIVKQGGVSDDVCEWKSASDGEFIQNPHTKRLYSNEPSMNNVYCNTCGKKIKIVGD